MPIQITYQEPGIYLSQWSGNITFQEIEGAVQEVAAIASEKNDSDRLVLILDGSKVKTIPFEIRQLQGVIRGEREVVAYLLVQAPIIGQIAGRLLNTLTSRTFELFDDIETAKVRARDILDNY